MAPRKAPRKRSSKPSIYRLAAADGVCTAFFVACSATFVELAPILAAYFGIEDAGNISIALVVALLLITIPLTQLLGGAIINPANNAAIYAIGKGSAKEHVVRAVGQALGGIAGAAIARLALPSDWQQTLSVLAMGLRPGADLLGGAACEAILGALLAFTVLFSGDLQSSFWQLWTPLIATVFAVKAGQSTSGPSLNPAYCLAWHFHYGLQSPAEHLLVYWVVPILSGLFGGWAYLGYQQFRRLPAARHAKTD